MSPLPLIRKTAELYTQGHVDLPNTHILAVTDGPILTQAFVKYGHREERFFDFF